MNVCDAHPAEPATTTITLPSGKQLMLCTHHKDQVVKGLVQQGKTFSVERDVTKMIHDELKAT